MTACRASDRRLFLIAGSSLALAAAAAWTSCWAAAMRRRSMCCGRRSAAAQPGAKVSWALAILKPDASDSLDSQRIALSTSDTTAGLLRQCRLAGPPARSGADRAAGRLRGQSAASMRCRADEDALHADYELSTDLRDFEARYATPDGVPTVAVTIIAHMANTRSRMIVANHTVKLTQAATANSVDAVVQAFDLALAQAIAEITQWALALPPPATTDTANSRNRSPRPRRKNPSAAFHAARALIALPESGGDHASHLRMGRFQHLDRLVRTAEIGRRQNGRAARRPDDGIVDGGAARAGAGLVAFASSRRAGPHAAGSRPSRSCASSPAISRATRAAKRCRPARAAWSSPSHPAWWCRADRPEDWCSSSARCGPAA